MPQLLRPVLAAVLVSLVLPALGADTFIEKKISYRSKNSNGGEITLTVPYIESDNKAAAQNINLFIHDQMLGTLPDPGPGQSTRLIELSAPMEQIEPAGMQLMNHGRTIAVSIASEGCGAYCSEGTSRFDFDTRNGHPIVTQEMLTPSGRTALGKRAMAENAARLKQEISRLSKLIAAHRPSKNRALGELREQVDMYQSCFDSDFDKEGSMYKYYINDPGVMGVGEGALSFSRSGCGGHAGRALNDLGDFEIVVKGQDLRPHLTAYGKYIIFGEGDGQPPVVNPYSQYFKGSINGAPITLFMGSETVLDISPQFETAHYYYDKYRQRIDLRLKRTGDRFELAEVDGDGKQKAALRFEMKGGKLTGQWTGNGKTLPFEAHAL